MSEVQELYPVEPVEETMISFQVERFGKTYKLKHLFRHPTAAMKRAWRRDPLLLWDRCILKVTGYALAENDSLWREKIDPEHKRVAVEKLLRI